MNRTLVGALALLAALTAAPRTTFARDLNAIRASGELRWGGDLQGGEPYVFEDEAHPGKLMGFEVEIADALGRRLGVRPKFTQNDWSSLIPGLERDDFDIILNGLEDTPERRARLGLSRPYFVYGETLTIRKSSGYASLDDLAGKRVGTLNQTVASDLLRQRPLEVVLYEGQEEPYFDLEKGRTEAVLLDHVIAERYGCPRPALRCLDGDVARGRYVIGVARNNQALLRTLDDALAAMLREGELERILSHYKLWDARQKELTNELARPAPEPLPRAAESASSPPRRHLTASQLRLFVEGALMTLLLSFSSFALASPLGVLVGVLRVQGGRVARAICTVYVELFRGTPLLLQLYVLYFGISEVVRLGPITAAVLGLGLNYAAYEAEVHRGALQAVPRGQTEAARSLGLSRWQTLRHVLLPQSLKNALPAVTNDFVALLKDSSLVSVITVVELTKRMTIVAVELRNWVTPGLLCAGLYFLMSFPLARFASRLERSLEHDQHSRLA
ncbi:MAG TPA: ABC transporter substrate-binding protein/permease [Polyangiaceae bacterium]|nr:ABC transporter substrate-binding protein/permease [Polyangiaceae bacterium]